MDMSEASTYWGYKDLPRYVGTLPCTVCNGCPAHIFDLSKRPHTVEDPASSLQMANGNNTPSSKGSRAFDPDQQLQHH